MKIVQHVSRVVPLLGAQTYIGATVLPIHSETLVFEWPRFVGLGATVSTDHSAVSRPAYRADKSSRSKSPDENRYFLSRTAHEVDEKYAQAFQL